MSEDYGFNREDNVFRVRVREDYKKSAKITKNARVGPIYQYLVELGRVWKVISY